MTITGQSSIVPIIPLANSSVLFPGSVQRIPVPSARSDIPALLSSIYSRASASAKRVDEIPIVCVPLTSPLLSRRGQRLIENDPNKYKELLEADPKNITKDRLYGYGTVAKITAIQGQNGAEFSILVQGISRVTLGKVTQESPFFEAKVNHHSDAVGAEELQSTDYREGYTQLKHLSRELVSYLRVSAFLLSNGSAGLNPLLSRRIEQFIAKKLPHEGGSLADFMMNIVNGTYEEKLQVLGAVDITARIQKVNELLEHQVEEIKSNIKVTTVTSTTIPIHIDPEDMEKMKRRIVTK